MDGILQEERFSFVSDADRAFIQAFDAEMNRFGYDFGGRIGSGYCWGRYMLIYTRSGAKSKTVPARIYLQEGRIVLRLFLNQVDDHRAFLEQAPAHIQEAFTGPRGDCTHDRVEAGGGCRFRKTYTLHGRRIEKCSGIVFEFPRPKIHNLCDYIALFAEFYPTRPLRASKAAPDDPSPLPAP